MSYVTAENECRLFLFPSLIKGFLINLFLQKRLNSLRESFKKILNEISLDEIEFRFLAETSERTNLQFRTVENFFIYMVIFLR